MRGAVTIRKKITLGKNLAKVNFFVSDNLHVASFDIGVVGRVTMQTPH